jgi:hypothetical protein
LCNKKELFLQFERSSKLWVRARLELGWAKLTFDASNERSEVRVNQNHAAENNFLHTVRAKLQFDSLSKDVWDLLLMTLHGSIVVRFIISIHWDCGLKKILITRYYFTRKLFYIYVFLKNVASKIFLYFTLLHTNILWFGKKIISRKKGTFLKPPFSFIWDTDNVSLIFSAILQKNFAKR